METVVPSLASVAVAMVRFGWCGVVPNGTSEILPAPTLALERNSIMGKSRKLISIEEVENGFIMTYTVAGSGQQNKKISPNVDGVKDQIAEWLDIVIDSAEVE